MSPQNTTLSHLLYDTEAIDQLLIVASRVDQEAFDRIILESRERKVDLHRAIGEELKYPTTLTNPQKAARHWEYQLFLRQLLGGNPDFDDLYRHEFRRVLFNAWWWVARGLKKKEEDGEQNI